MDGAALLALDKAALVELIMRLHERVAELEALPLYLRYGHHLPQERPVAACGGVFGLRIGEGAIAAALARLAARAWPEVGAIRDAARASPTIYSDETGVRVDGRN